MNKRLAAVAGTKGRYFVSDEGYVISLKDGEPRRLKNRTVGKSPKNKAWRPYQNVMIYYDGVPKTRPIHRLVAIAFIPNPENKKEVNHIDNDPLNNHYTNLEWVTPSENVRHSFKTTNRKRNTNDSLKKYRAANPKPANTKLSPEAVEDIRASYIPYVVSLNYLARKHGVSKKAILLTLQNKTHKV